MKFQSCGLASQKISSRSTFIAALILLLITISHLALPSDASAQAGLRESLKRMDRDEDGRIDPDEITSLARPYLERVGKRRRMSLDKSHRIDEWQEASRIYHALQNGVSGEEIRIRSEPSIRKFEPDDEDVIIPDFGLAEIKYSYTQDDLDEAERSIRRYDRNGDGYIDRREARRADWTHRDPFNMDVNNDDRLSRLELGQRYARRRMVSGDADELVQKSRRVGNGIQRSDRDKDDDDRGNTSWWRSGGSRHWLAASMLGRFDSNRNGRLEPAESKSLNLPVGQIDVDRDGDLSRDELQSYLSEIQDELGDDAEGLPGWFYELDKDSDDQVTMPEFTDRWTADKVAEFAMLDANQDGLLTAEEVATNKATMGGAFRNDTAEVLPPKKTIISEIEIDDDVQVGDLNLQLSVTHTNVGDLDAFLTGPDGTRVELFTDIGGRGDHFDETVFDDDVETPITKARPPFKGSFIPEGKIKRQPSLSSFDGKSARGVWQLVIRATRSDRFGMLHNWALMVRPEEKMPGEFSVTGGETGTASAVPMIPTADALSGVDSDAESSERKPASKWTKERVSKFKAWAAEANAAGKPIDADTKARWFEANE